MGRIFFVRKIIHKWFGLPRKALALILTVVLTLSVLGGILAQIKPTQTEPSPAPADDPPPGPYDAPDFGVLSEVRFLDVGMNYIGGIALDAAHKVWSWGWNQHGQLGINKGFQMGPTSPPNRMGYAGGMIRLPYFVDNDIDIVDIAAGYHFNLALDDEGNVYSWGHNGQQQTGFTTNTTTSGVGRIEPAVVQGLPKIVKIKTNNAEITNGISMALDENGGLWVWGANLAGTHGQGNTTTTAAYQATPHKVIFPENVQVVDFTGGGWGGANANVQVIDSNGDRWGWGINDGAYRMLGLGVATATIIQPTKAARQPGMGDLVQIDSSFRATVALDENHNVWQWGRLFLGPGVGSETTIPIPTVLEIDPAEITRLGYTPIPQRVTAGESVCYFIDQYGRPWAWGSGRYFGFGREGGYEDANSQVAAKAQQWPREIGDGDTQTYDDSPKIRPPTAMGNRGIHLHPTIYDEKYADNPMEDIWKDLAFRPIPKLKYIYAQRSAYTLMDENGNIYKWTNDGSGAIAWGWDYTNPQYDPPDSGNIKEGLYNVYSYEVMFMRGSPRMAPLELTIDKPVKKIYKGVSSLDTDTLAFKLKIPPSFTSAAMNINIDRKIRVMKYVIIPYDPSDPNFQITDKPTKDQFNDAYDAAAAGMKGDFLNGEIIESSNVEQIINENIVIDDNCKVWVMVSDEGYVQGELRDNILVHTADNFYTPVNLYERGVERNDNDVELYPSTQEQVAKVYPTAYDSAKFGSDTAKYSDQEPDVYGVPLDVNGAVITAPIFGHDQVEITALDVPRYAVSGTKPDSTPQINPVIYTLNQDYISVRPHYNDRNLDGTMTAQAITENTHTFYYSFALPYKGAYINGAARPSNGLQTAPREVDLGTSIVYRITAENKGTAGTTVTTTITDVVPVGLDNITSISHSGTYNPVNRTITWILANQTAGSEVVVSFAATVSLPDVLMENIAEVRYQSGIVEGSNPTYHRSKLLDPVPASKNAHVNSNPVDNGTVTRPVDVKRGDDITYEINVARPPAVGGSSGFQPMPKLTQPGKINFINGSFEQPEVATTPMLPEDNPWGISHTDRAYYNYTRVPGWYTVPTSPSEIGEEFWNCLQFFAGTNPVWVTYPYPDGFQSVELNAHYLSRLYQICETEPGTTVYWELYHEACQMPDGTPYSGGNLSSEDSLNVYIYATPAPGEAGDSNANRGTPPAGSRQNNNSPLVTRVDERWKKYSGSYTVPAGQESTIFAFEADASYTGNPRFGNYLDGIRLYTNSYIDLTKTNNAPSAGVNTGDIVTYTVKAKNLGESDASGVIISDILPEGTELATSEPNFLQVAAGTGAPVNMPYDYNPATRALTVPVGAGSTTTTGGLVKGDGSFSSDCQNEYTLTFKARVTDGGRDAYENQAKVVFKDRYHESEPGSSYTNYSNVSSFDARVSRHTPVTVTDIIPAGLTVTSTDPAAVVTELPGGQQQVVWTLNSIPSEGITLTVVTEVTAAGTYVNSATATMTGMRDSETNHTYHKELTLPPQAKNAHLNGAATNNGTLLAPVDVRRNDEITYDIVVDNPVDPIPQYDVLFAVDCSGTVLGAPARKVQVENLVAGLRGGIFANRPDSRIALLGMNSPSDQNGTYMPQNCTNNPSLLNLHYDTTFQTSSDYDIAQETAMTQPAQGFANDDPAQFLNAAIDKIKGLNTQFGSGTYLKTLKGRDELTSGHIPVIIFISDFEMTDGANLDYNNSGQNYWSAVMKNLSDRYASEVPNGILLTVRLDSFMGGYDFASAAADNRMMDYLSPAGRAAKGWRFTKAGGPLNALEIPTLSEVAGSLFDQATQTQRVASVTDTLPAGLTYVSHTNAAGSSSSFVSATNTVSWNWSNLPAGKTTVTVKAKVVPANNEREFVNHATVTIDGVISNTNSTYHKLSTAILNLRQMVTGFSGKTIMPYKAYFNLENDGRIFGITADSNKDTLNVPFRKVLVDFSDNDDLIYYIKNLVPQYYVSDGYVITDEYIPGDPGKAGHSAEVRDPDEPDFIIEADFGEVSEYWVTVFIRAASSTAEQDWAFKTNHFGTIYPE